MLIANAKDKIDGTPTMIIGLSDKDQRILDDPKQGAIVEDLHRYGFPFKLVVMRGKGTDQQIVEWLRAVGAIERGTIVLPDSRSQPPAG